MTKIPHRLYLTEDQMPKQWFNLRAVMKEQPDPMLHPATLQPMTERDLYPIFCEELARQELDETHAYIDIPEEIQEIYKMYRPSPLIRAYALEKHWKPRQRSTTSLRATTPRVRTSSTRQLHRPTTPSSRVCPA